MRRRWKTTAAAASRHRRNECRHRRLQVKQQRAIDTKTRRSHEAAAGAGRANTSNNMTGTAAALVKTKRAARANSSRHSRLQTTSKAVKRRAKVASQLTRRTKLRLQTPASQLNKAATRRRNLRTLNINQYRVVELNCESRQRRRRRRHISRRSRRQMTPLKPSRRNHRDTRRHRKAAESTHRRSSSDGRLRLPKVKTHRRQRKWTP